MTGSSEDTEQYEQEIPQTEDKNLQLFANDSDNENQNLSTDVGHDSMNVADDMVESALKTKQFEQELLQSEDNETRGFCVDNIDSKLGSFRQIAEQNDTDVCMHELTCVHDLAKQLEHALSRFLGCLDELRKGEKVDGRSGKTQEMYEHAGFQRDVEECVATSQGKHESGTEGLLEKEAHCLVCLLKQRQAHPFLISPCCSTSFRNGCKCACHSNEHRNNTTVSSGYISEDMSSACTGSNPRWDKVCVDSNRRCNEVSVPECVLACRRLGDWGLTGNDYVQRHIVTSSPIIATFRDLKPDEI